MTKDIVTALEVNDHCNFWMEKTRQTEEEPNGERRDERIYQSGWSRIERRRDQRSGGRGGEVIDEAIDLQ